jgi:hypothetical protein
MSNLLNVLLQFFFVSVPLQKKITIQFKVSFFALQDGLPEKVGRKFCPLKLNASALHEHIQKTHRTVTDRTSTSQTTTGQTSMGRTTSDPTKSGRTLSGQTTTDRTTSDQATAPQTKLTFNRLQNDPGKEKTRKI